MLDKKVQEEDSEDEYFNVREGLRARGYPDEEVMARESQVVRKLKNVVKDQDLRRMLVTVYTVADMETSPLSIKRVRAKV